MVFLRRALCLLFKIWAIKNFNLLPKFVALSLHRFIPWCDILIYGSGVAFSLHLWIYVQFCFCAFGLYYLSELFLCIYWLLVCVFFSFSMVSIVVCLISWGQNEVRGKGTFCFLLRMSWLELHCDWELGWVGLQEPPPLFGNYKLCLSAPPPMSLLASVVSWEGQCCQLPPVFLHRKIEGRFCDQRIAPVFWW